MKHALAGVHTLARISYLDLSTVLLTAKYIEKPVVKTKNMFSSIKYNNLLELTAL
ncbi:hypothetical protein MYRA21_2460 [Myroides sp. A21]|nr:hypothetical protein MYRA21_2460 [Myroides sp. A21]